MIYDLIIIGILSGLLLGLTGTYTYVQNINYLAGAISHATMGGIGIALFLQANYGININTFYGALVFAIIFAIIIALVQTKFKDIDGIIGVAWAMGMSIGLLFISMQASFADPSVYLFGNIMLISKQDIYLTLIVTIFVLILLIIFYNKLILNLSDTNFAKFSGLNITKYNIITLMIIAIVITLMINIIGIILIIAMLSIPPAIAKNYSKKLWHMLILSSVFAIIFNLLGLFISIKFDINSGPSIVLLASFFYFLSLVILKIKAIYKQKIISLLLLFIPIFSFSCMKSSSRSSNISCTDNSCINSLCSDFPSVTGSICTSGVCEIKNIPTRLQTENTTSTGDVSCGPTSVSIQADGLLENYSQKSGWLEDFSNITSNYDPTGQSNECGNSLNCRKIVATEKKMIPSYDTEYATLGASYQEVQDIFSVIANDADINTNYTDSYPNKSTASRCNFVSGDFKINNETQNLNIVLYIRYIKQISSTSTYNGVRLEKISLSSTSTNGGHFIAMSGYDATGTDIYFKFHDPVNQLVRYKIVPVSANTPFCVKEVSSRCSLYQQITLSVNGSSHSSFSYLIAVEGEEASSSYNYKIIANISSLEFAIEE